MAMKKRFLGLAMAAAMVIPATTVHAAGIQTIPGVQKVSGDDHILGIQVPVSGTVLDQNGETPQGKIEVELPTAMAFAVDKQGNFVAPDKYTVTNKSSVGVTLGVSQFKESDIKGGITLNKVEGFDANNKKRTDVAMSLNGYAGGKNTSIDLSQIDPLGDTEDVLDVKAGGTGLLSLSGQAGKQSPGDDVNQNGTQEDFTLVFEIIKNEDIN